MSQDPVAFAKSKTEDLLTFFGLNVEVEAGIEDDVVEINVPSTNLNGFLIGQKGDNLRSLQHLISLMMQNAELETARINLDVADYKKQRAERLADQVKQWAEAVSKTGQEMQLQQMNAADRRIVHRTASEIDGITSESRGEGRERRVWLVPG